MTDNEIIKALGCCTSHKGYEACISGCPFQEQELCQEDADALLTHSLDLINRQQAEIERLNAISDRLNTICTNQDLEIEKLKKENERFADIGKMYSEVRAEAIKEFAERLKEEIVEALRSNYNAQNERILKTNEKDAEEMLCRCRNGKCNYEEKTNDFKEK